MNRFCADHQGVSLSLRLVQSLGNDSQSNRLKASLSPSSGCRTGRGTQLQNSGFWSTKLRKWCSANKLAHLFFSSESKGFVNIVY